MGVYDRDYYRQGSYGSGFQVKSMVGTLIVINIVIWVLQVVFLKSGWIERFFACHPRDVFGDFFIWQVLTANSAKTRGFDWQAAVAGSGAQGLEPLDVQTQGAGQTLTFTIPANTLTS